MTFGKLIFLGSVFFLKQVINSSYLMGNWQELKEIHTVQDLIENINNCYSSLSFLNNIEKSCSMTAYIFGSLDVIGNFMQRNFSQVGEEAN